MKPDKSTPKVIEGTLGGIPFRGTLSDKEDLEIDPNVIIKATERQLFYHRLTSRIFGFGFMSAADKNIEQGMIETLNHFRADAEALRKANAAG